MILIRLKTINNKGEKQNVNHVARLFCKITLDRDLEAGFEV